MGLSRRVGRVLGRRGAAEPRPDRPPLIGRGRFDVTVMAILKNEAPNMEEWLCHHLAIGVDHFFLYDNGSTDELHEVLKPYADHGIVTTVYFPMRGLQRDANNHVVRFFGDTAEWIAYVDIDEFLVPEHDEPIGAVMARFPDAEQVLVSRKEFCYSGQRTPVAGLVTETYREYSEHVPRMGTSEILAKPIVRPRGVARVGIHNAYTVHGRTVNTAGQPTAEEATVIEDPSYANLQMNHYFTKSWQEFQAKRTRATTSTHAFQLPDVPFDIPGSVDHVIDRWQPRTRALMEEMRTLPRSPSRFGSRLRLPGFPINDLFGQEATAVTSNEVAGVPAARKRPAFRGLPMPGVRGATVRADDHGYAPAAGRFLASAHLAQQMAWLEAEVTWAVVGGDPPLAVEGGSVEPAEVPLVRFDAPRASLVIRAGGAALRCHALASVLRVDAADGAVITVELAAREAGEWRRAAGYELPGAGTYVGLVALDKRPRTIEAVRVTLDGASAVMLYDLALLTFG
jgi:hypothetical protein